jgi:hypothetical protein
MSSQTQASQMQRDIEEGQQPQRPAEPDQVQPDTPQGGDRQRGDQELQTQNAQLMLDRLDRIGPQGVRHRAPDQKAQRNSPKGVDHPGRHPPGKGIRPVDHRVHQ